MIKVIIKTSGIQGKGAFANRDFKKGEVVIDWLNCSEIISSEEFSKLSHLKKKMVALIKGKYVLFHPPGCYVNHCCSANTKAIKLKDIALRDIKKGEEITANYIAEKVPLLNFKCHCGSPNCKKIKN